MAADPIDTRTALRAALETARRVRTPADLAAALDRLCALTAEALACETVVIHLHRPAWDDFAVATVHGSVSTRRRLLGTTATREEWAPDPAAHPLSAPLRRSDGQVLGIISAEEPREGARTGDPAGDVLTTMGQLAALAIEQAHAVEREAAYAETLERLLVVSSRIADRRSRGGIMDEICAGISEALGFEHVAVLVGATGGTLRAAGSAGWRTDDPALLVDFSLEQVGALLRPAHERHGCHLIEHEEAEAVLAPRAPAHRSQSNGRGPLAWDRHWLIAALHGSDGRLRGIIRADDPVDRLLPDRLRLQALRLFADQAAAALDDGHGLDALSHPAAHDSLTGLANRATFADRLRHAVKRTKRAPGSIAVLFVDLDRFKDVNDAHGHSAGDELLRVIAARIDEGLRPGDTVARFGGDEFVILCEDIDGPAAALEVAERVRIALSVPVPLPVGLVGVTASIGIALPDRPDRAAEEILQAADRAMYEAKAAGRDGARIASPGAGWP